MAKKSRARQLRRERQSTLRRREAGVAEARQTQQEQAVAAARLDFAQRRRRHVIAWSMWVVAAVMAIGHFFEHTGTVHLMSSGLQDLLIGWPMAGALAVIGAIVYGT